MEYRGGLYEFADRVQGLAAYGEANVTPERFRALKVAYGITPEQGILFDAAWDVAAATYPAKSRYDFQVLACAFLQIRHLLFAEEWNAKLQGV
jgi:hypothetical protein